MTSPGTQILALGHYLPERRVTNAELEARLGLDEGWIKRRTGIVERRYAADDEALSDLAVAAGQQCLAQTGFNPARIAMVLLATSTPDHLLPPTAPLVAERLGLNGAGGIDMAGACSGFLYALNFADAHVRRTGELVLVIAANILSQRTNPEDRASVILFGDGAGAVLVAPSEHAHSGITGHAFQTVGADYDLIKIAAGGSRQPFDPSLDPAAYMMTISDGRAVFQRAVKVMINCANEALAKANISIDDIDLFVPHQANWRIMRAVQEGLGLEKRKVASTVEKFANSSAATIPITLSETQCLANLRPGQTVLMVAAGAGLTGGAIVYKVA